MVFLKKEGGKKARSSHRSNQTPLLPTATSRLGRKEKKKKINSIQTNSKEKKKGDSCPFATPPSSLFHALAREREEKEE